MKKEITLGNLLAILIPILVSLLGWGISLNSRVEANGNKARNNKESIEEVNQDLKRYDQKLDNFNEKINDKMDENFKIIIDKLDDQRREQSSNR